jgi:methylglutaconyl-CoA hydratase
MSDALVLVKNDPDGVTTMTLNRPEQRNALNRDLLRAMLAALQNFNADSERRVLILTGAGPALCAGLDLKEARDTSVAHESAALAAEAIQTLAFSPKTTIAAVNGPATAGGAGLMLACDFAIAAETFTTGFPEVQRGLVAGIVMTFLRRKVAEPVARELLLLGELVDADRALAMGLVSRVVRDAELISAAQALAQRALKAAPGAVAMTKQLFDEEWHLSVREHFAKAEALHKSMRTTDEAREGLAAFAEKRPPAWFPHA